MPSATQLLTALEAGDAAAAGQLLPLVYDELRRAAAGQLAQERPGQTLDATALVHEAYLRLVGAADAPRWQSRRHFCAAAAEAMRRVLVDRARARRAEKRGGGRARVDFDPAELPAPDQTDDLLALDEALAKLSAVDASAAELVQLRCFAGLTLREAAAALELPPRSADRLWAYARAWLLRELGPA